MIDSASEIGIGQEITKQVVERWGAHEGSGARRRGSTKSCIGWRRCADRPERELRYKVVLVDVPMINALTLPGGTVLVFRGLVDMVNKQHGRQRRRLGVGARPRVRARGAAPRHGHDPGGVVAGRRSGKRSTGGEGDLVCAAHDHLARARVRGRSVRRALRLSRRLQPGGGGDAAREDARRRWARFRAA